MSTRTMPALPAPHLPDRPEAQPFSSEGLRKALLYGGVISSLYYVGMSVYVPMQWEGYSMASQAVSELSAIDAPTRALWVPLGVVYTFLVVAFGFGVWMSAGGSRALRSVGALFIADGVLGAFWPPMHLRGVETSLTDLLHIVWTVAWLAVMLAVMGLSAAALGRRFRLYTFATLALFITFGTLTWMAASNIARNLPTPWLGLWERINMAIGMLWIAVLAVALLRRTRQRSPRFA